MGGAGLWKQNGGNIPMNMKNKMAAVISAPQLAGDSTPNMANTKHGGEKLMKILATQCLSIKFSK